jgi:hypothetical protein
MFPNNVEFFVWEKEAERQAEIKQIRLGRLVSQGAGTGRRHLAYVFHWLGTHLIAWAEKLQVQPILPASSPSSEQTLP